MAEYDAQELLDAVVEHGEVDCLTTSELQDALRAAATRLRVRRALDSAPVTDEDAELVVLALAGKPKRVSFRVVCENNFRLPPGVVDASGVGRARGRASSRLIAAHRAEFDRYWVDEQWKIARGETE